jgi:hypothetical protein
LIGVVAVAKNGSKRESKRLCVGKVFVLINVLIYIISL